MLYLQLIHFTITLSLMNNYHLSLGLISASCFDHISHSALLLCSQANNSAVTWAFKHNFGHMTANITHCLVGIDIWLRWHSTDTLSYNWPCQHKLYYHTLLFELFMLSDYCMLITETLKLSNIQYSIIYIGLMSNKGLLIPDVHAL